MRSGNVTSWYNNNTIYKVHWKILFSQPFKNAMSIVYFHVKPQKLSTNGT